MKTEIQKLAGLTRKLNVEVPPDVVRAALEKMYRDVQRVAKFKGFRPGKAPLNMVKSEYKSRVESDVTTKIIEDHYSKAVSEHSLQPVNFPEIEFDGLKDGEPLKFSATFEVRPDVELKKYVGLEIEKEKFEVVPEMIDNIIQDIRKNRSVIQPMVEPRPAQMGDVSIIDFHGKVEGNDLPGGNAQEYQLELGTHQFIPGFEEGIVGMKAGETKILHLKFPEAYNAKEIAGKDVEFAVTLKEIKTKALPELDDEFAKSLGAHTSLQHLKEEITKDVKTREEKRVRDDVKNRVLNALVEKNPMQIPRSMVAEQKKMIIEDVKQRMEREGTDTDQFEEYKKKWDKDFEKSAEFVIHSSLLVNAIANKEGLQCNDEDFTKKLADYAVQSGIELEKIKGFYGKQENQSRLRFQITEEKVMAFLIENAKINELPRDKLTKIPQQEG